MKQLLKPIKLNQTGYSVSLLHKLLALLELPVSATEVSAAKAGIDTQKKVHTLLKQLNLRSDNDSVLLNEDAIKVIVKAMTDNGLLDAERKFEVSGEVRLSTGSSKKRQRLIAFDLDLKAVSIYRDLESLKQAQKKGGFEFLGEVISDTKGRYKIQFYDWFYKRAERKLADIVVFAVDNKDKVIGRSRLVNTGDYADKRFVRDLEVVIVNEDERTEYQVLMALLEPFLEQSEISLTEIAKSSEQLDFTANELDISRPNLELAASAATLNLDNPKLKHELLYGIARQDIYLDWLVLYRKHQEELRDAIATSAKEKIISEVAEGEIEQFITNIQQSAIAHLLDSEDEEGNKKFLELLSIALPEKKQRQAFLKSVNEFKGDDFNTFWETHLPKQPEFKDQPEVIPAIQLTQQLTLLSGGHPPLVKLLQAKDEVQTAESLVNFSDDNWMAVIKAAGVPEFVEGKDEAEKQKVYAQHLRNRINASFPTQSIGKMVKENHLGIENSSVAASVSKLFSSAKFDIRKHRLHDLQQEIEVIANEQNADPETVKLEAMKLQRVFQVSTSPEVMRVLYDNKLDSAYSIANIPRANFARLYGKAFGGQQTAITVHQRAEQIAKRAEAIVMDTRHFDTAVPTPAKAMSPTAKSKADEILQITLPNFQNLFGSRDLCECEHCRSISSPAAYFVELLQFLNKSEFYVGDVESQANKRSPYDFLVGSDETGISGRRPDLAELALSCENTNTLIPYIDLSNEIMECYVAEESLENFKEENTGDVTAEELRANPQRTNSHNTVTEAYQKLANAKFPFSLPFHQPLDEIRTYSDFLNISRYQVMRALFPQPNQTNIQQEMTAESLKLSAEGYDILVDNTTDDVALREYYGLDSASGELEDLVEVRKFLAQSGTSYEQLIELLKTRFINPHQQTIDYLENHFSQSKIDVDVIYNWLKQIKNGDPTDDTEIETALAESGNSISIVDLKSWAENNFNNFQQVITLFEPTSACNLDNIELKTIKGIYEKLATSEIAPASWSKIHRFIRLWRKTGWSIHQTDLILGALGEADIRHETLSMIESVLLLQKESRLSVEQLAVLWGDIDTYGEKSLYKKLFLNKSAQQIDPVFKEDKQGNYFSNDPVADDEVVNFLRYQPHILAAYRLTEEELNSVLVKAGLNIDSVLSIENLSAVYRYVVFAKALKLSIVDFCLLIDLLEISPFEMPPSPLQTYQFYTLADSVRAAKFKPAALDYIFNGNLSVDSRLGLDKDKVLKAFGAIRSELMTIEQSHPQEPEILLTSEVLAVKLSISFKPEAVNRLIEIVEGTAVFKLKISANLNTVIPAEMISKVQYVKGNGWFICLGIMSDSERDSLKNNNNSDEIKTAIDKLYSAPEVFIDDNFAAVFNTPDNLDQVKSMLLNRPLAAPEVSLQDKLGYIYSRYLPLLKKQLQKNAIVTNLADLIGLSETATKTLIEARIETLITAYLSSGFSATYFNNKNFDPSLLPKPPVLRIDKQIAFEWVKAPAEDRNLPVSDSFSVQWEGYIAAPTSGEYTLIVDVEEADESFVLYLDDVPILEKQAAAAVTTLETVVNLDAVKWHSLVLKYVEDSGASGVKLRWKTATQTPEVIPAKLAFPAREFNDLIEQVGVLHRAALLISGFDISDEEIVHLVPAANPLIAAANPFVTIDFDKTKIEHWRRLRDYRALTESIPQSQAQFVELFEYSNRLDRILETEETIEKAYLKLVDKTHQATNWRKIDINVLTRHFIPLAFDNTAQPEVVNLELIFNSFKNEIVLNQIHNVIGIVAKSGLSAQSIIDWGAANSDFDQLHATAQALKNTVKAKYEDKEWLSVASGLSDKLREQQNQALVSYLLVDPSIQKENITDADGLYEHFLIDVQMGACMDTSRIVQANAAIQLFVNRILLNLEADIPPDAIDVDRWDWMKNYRVWEANRKVFLYPQNWLEPEWRNNRSEFFKDLESHLLQNDITERSVEQGLRNYLMSMNEVANLDVCGMHQENYDDGRLKFLHVFGRTHNLPYKYFYRSWNEHKKWSAWEKVQLDIRGAEDGKDSGVHLIPVVWKGRLYLFWPEFMETAKAPELAGDLKDAGDNPASDLEPKKCWEIRLACSEYVEGTWSAKQISKEFIPLERYLDIYEEPSLRFIVDIDHEGKLTIATHVEYEGEWLELWAFILSDITSKIDIRWFKFIAEFQMEGLHLKGWKSYKLFFMKFTKLSNLELLDNVYLKTSVDHRLLISPTRKNYSPTLRDPFFFSDTYRSYFVRSGGSTTNWSLGEQLNPSALVKAVFSASRPPDSTDSMPILGMPSSTGMAFSAEANRYGESTRTEKLQFHTFHHPFSNNFVTRLNQGGIASLMGSDTEDTDIQDLPINEIIRSDEGTTFEAEYDPDFEGGLVKPHIDNLSDRRTYYQENICFDTYGANSLYNWELFFHAPLYIATRLSKNGKYKEAMKCFHYIFDPITNKEPDVNSENETSRYWKVKPFKTTPIEILESLLKDMNRETDPESENYKEDSIYFDHVTEWRKNPFDPHLVASNRPIAYMEHVVIKYIENLVDWGDSLFRQFTRENVYEATQLYVIASHILGKRPEIVPKRGSVKTETYTSLKDKLDAFGNALVELENVFPVSSEVYSSTISTSTNLLGIGEALYFCIPANAKLMEYWDTVEDRLFKIRHCQNIEGIEQSLALFSPPIEPAALIQARSQGLSLSNILTDLNSPPPLYRFAYLLQKANEFCNDVKALGSAVLSALEKRDGEELGRLRASQETNLLERVTEIRERQILAAKLGIENLLKTRETAELRLAYYKELLGDDSDEPVGPPEIDGNLTADGPLPGDTIISPIETNVDMSLVGSGESGVKLISKEKEALDKNSSVKALNVVASSYDLMASIINIFPDVEVFGAPLGTGVSTENGGTKAAATIGAYARVYRGISEYVSAEASQASIMGGFLRRTHDWAFQANLAIRGIIELDKQITSADIQLQIAEKELKNHLQQIENSKETELFLKDKFTNQELYQWMKEQLFSVYKQSYNLAFEMAKKAEKAYQYELGTETTSFIQYGYWDSARQGLVAGEKLQLGLRQLDNEYLNRNRRELELSKSISIALLNPLALIELRETGKCHLSLPEELFDLDYQGHYFRRIKSVSLSIPCVAGPYTSVNCSLRLLNNTYRKNTQPNTDFSGLDGYEQDNDEGIPLDDDRFRSSNVPVSLMATSSGQNDAGLFEFSFRDERYLPFEGAGVISNWMVELTEPKDLRQFDYATISDVILHLKYTARESSGSFKGDAIEHLHNHLKQNDNNAAPSLRMFNLKQDFPTQWHRFLHPTAPELENIFELEMSANLFPILDKGKKLNVTNISVFAKPGSVSPGTSYKVVISPPAGIDDLNLVADSQVKGLHSSSVDTDIEIDLVATPTTWQLTMDKVLAENEIEDVLLILGYHRL